MKNFKYILGFILAFAFFTSCDNKDYELGDIVAPSNLQITAEIVGADTANPYGDGSGDVNFSATADNAITYKYIYNNISKMVPTGDTSYTFAKTGTYTYTVTVIAVGTAGATSSASIEVQVLALYDPPTDLLQMLYGDGEKTWRIKAESAAHFGVGPADSTTPSWWSAAAYDKDGLGAYDDRIIFKSDGTLTYQTNGTAYGQSSALDASFGTTWTANSNNEYENYPLENFNDTWALTAPGGQETLTFNGYGYHGFYVGGDHSYTILSRTSTQMTLRTIGADGLGWFCILTSEDEVSNEFESEYNNLVWSDEFDTDGAPDAAKWTYDLGTGTDGWGNQEVQTYTNDAANVIVDGGILKITAIKSGNAYTSARLKSDGLYSFKYGRVEVKAKLPASAGTWPAIWMLGSNFSTVSWPTCGEIDIMEQTGSDKSETLGTLHWFNTSGNNNASYGTSTTVSNASSEFHLYSLEWTEDKINILVDNVSFFSMDNSSELPFYDKNFFMILNVAMGGTLGGTIDSAFTEDSMEIDYVRVYQ